MIYVLGYRKKDINLLAAFLTLIIIILLACFFPNLFFEREKQHTWYENTSSISEREKRLKNKISIEKIEVANKEKTVTQKEEKEELKNTKVEIKDEKNTSNDECVWRIEIPTLQLEAPISEGTSQEVLAETVGHFEESNLWDGNVALAAHNRGYQCNFFQNIKELKEGDEIIYKTDKGERKYKVVLNKIIKETNWSYIENTEDNRITLITCEADKREYRRCIQGIEIKTEKEKKI